MNSFFLPGPRRSDEPCAIRKKEFIMPLWIANVVAFLASPKSLAVNGDAIAVSGGLVGPIYY